MVNGSSVQPSLEEKPKRTKIQFAPSCEGGVFSQYVVDVRYCGLSRPTASTQGRLAVGASSASTNINLNKTSSYTVPTLFGSHRGLTADDSERHKSFLA
ncbi:hypothetical protein T265_09921 [Opisthorchis viverrini]|uniref:Uncharacterized protein n=1 Tax=Opisthorchis viverrini TaxID=6198 RepID=A0A074Z440_OPIVI|nr:hypothetical protein T265_09921 [Opisthorchis viverrini]KER21856.1 hypothetical protein T265_09921 [Opisthorchis viverrini]